MASQGEEMLETATIRKVAKSLDESWPELALRLDIIGCEKIQREFADPKDQAEEMLATWREYFAGDNPIEYLAKALIAMDRADIAQDIGPLQQLPQCPCGNADPFQFRRYFSKDDDDLTRIIGLCCTCCSQEWLEERFLFHPDTHNTRPAVKLSGVTLKKQLQVPIEMNPAFQVHGSRTKIENSDYLTDYLKVGDHVTWHRPLGIYWHHAIVSDIGREEGIMVKVIHWTKTNCRVVRIVEKWIDLRKEKGDMFRIDYEEQTTGVNTPELVIARAKSRVGDTGYGLVCDNCESFASYCKTGVAESCQVVWFYNKCKAVIYDALVTVVKSLAKAGSIIAKEFANKGVREVVGATENVFAAEVIERLGQSTDVVGAGFVLFFEGIACVFDLDEIYANRKTGDISRTDFIKSAFQRVSEALFGAGLAIGLGIAGQAAGAAVGGAAGTLAFPGFGTAVGAFFGSIVGGVIGSFIGRPLGSLIGSPIGRFLTSMVGTDDRAVKGIEDLNPGDQVVFYGNLLHPRHHAIVVNCDLIKGKIMVIHNTFQEDVVEQFVDFIPPVYRLVHEAKDCYTPEEVIARARSKIGDDTYKYSLAWNNCKCFARWCKQK